jgi:hypothetical protein
MSFLCGRQYYSLLGLSIAAVLLNGDGALGQQRTKEGVRAAGLRWSRLSEQIFRVDKWSLCRG